MLTSLHRLGRPAGARSVLIDNSDGALPLVSGSNRSRTLFRSGDPNTQWNPVRLLDIQELLSHTGMDRCIIVGRSGRNPGC